MPFEMLFAAFSVPRHMSLQDNLFLCSPDALAIGKFSRCREHIRREIFFMKSLVIFLEYSKKRLKVHSKSAFLIMLFFRDLKYV